MTEKPKPLKRKPRASKGRMSKQARTFADEFFAYKEKHPEPVPYEKLTPLQKRMQSGGG